MSVRFIHQDTLKVEFYQRRKQSLGRFKLQLVIKTVPTLHATT